MKPTIGPVLIVWCHFYLPFFSVTLSHDVDELLLKSSMKAKASASLITVAGVHL